VATLHSCVYRIRKVLDEAGGPELRRRPRGYLLDVPEPERSIDAHRFEELVAAARRALDEGDHAAATTALRKGLALWRGEAFRGIEAAAVRERAAGLAELRLDAAEWCLTAELELGRHQAVLAELEALTGEHPYREGFWALLMTALYRSGRQAAALEAYQRLYRLLDEELGIRPRPSLQALQQRILEGAPDLEAPRAGAPGLVPRMLPARLRDLTGRADQLNALNRLLPASIDGSSAVIASVAGTAGVGRHGQTLDSIGYIHHLRGDHRKAVEYFRQAVSELQRQGDRYAESEGLTHLGDARLAAGDREGARASWREALGILDELGHRDAEQVCAKLTA
jgi:DNA-binding SARP family transcriptional activator